MSDNEPPRVRPYVITGTNPGRELATLPLEALVATTASADLRQLVFERRTIADLCRSGPRSIGELASSLNVPLGVVGLLVADMAAIGDVEVCETGTDTDLVERLIRGIAAL